LAIDFEEYPAGLCARRYFERPLPLRSIDGLQRDREVRAVEQHSILRRHRVKPRGGDRDRVVDLTGVRRESQYDR